MSSSLSAHPEIVNRWITALPERKIDPLHDEIMDFAALFEGGLSQRFVDRFGRVRLEWTTSDRGRRPAGCADSPEAVGWLLGCLAI